MTVGTVLGDAIPLIPDADEARRWAETELADPSYAAAEPTPIDRLARGFMDALASLFQHGPSGAWGPVLAAVVVAVLVAVVLVALLVWGRPRLRPRVAEPSGGGLFGDARDRTSAQLRADADAHAANEAWADAIAARFRAIARALDERGLVETPPGATVHAFARAAGIRFPAETDALETAARAFDDVRYLRRPGTREAYTFVCALDERVGAARAAALVGAA